MRLPIAVLACTAFAISTTGCSRHVAVLPMPTPESRQSGKWHDTATLIQSGRYKIYFHGMADPAAAPAGTPWSGKISGDIFVSSPDGNITIPDGTVSFGPDGTIRVSGAHRITVPDPSAATH